MVPCSRRALAAAALAATLAASLATLSACDDASGPAGDLRDAQRRWRATRPTSYELRQSVSCFCPLPPQPVTLLVRGDSIVAAVDARGAALSAPIVGLYRTVDGLFALIEQARSRGAADLRATYDPARGYPTTVVIDYIANAADDEIAYQLSGLVAR